VGWVRVVVLLLGVFVVLATFGSAVRTVVIPRGVPARIGRFVFLNMRRVFRLRARPGRSYEDRDRVMALYAPVSLLVLLLVWETAVFFGYMLIFWALGQSLADAFVLSGSSVLTLGFAAPPSLPNAGVAYTEAAVGLILLALLITYLPSIYGVFSRRENLVAGMEVRAGSPPSAAEILQRSWRVDGFAKLSILWRRGEQWFLELRETHTSFPAVVFFRSPQPEPSLRLAVIDRPFDADAAYCIRAGYLALRSIAQFFGIPFDQEPRPGDPISITRDEFEEVCQSLAEQGLPLKEDQDKAWKDWCGWRVNYDRVLIALAGLTMAPYAPWSSDRSVRDWRPRGSLRELRRS
jgi:hypothetical protein